MLLQQPAHERLGLERLPFGDARAAVQAGEALQKLRTARFDVVLLDVHLPGSNGPQFLQALREDAGIAQVPVIAVSAADDIDGIARCLEAGADDWLPREFRPAMLRARLSAALDRKRLRDTRGLRREMEVARNIQRDFLPESLPLARGVQLDAVWVVKATAGGSTRSGRTTAREPARGAGYDALAGAYSRALAVLSEDVATAIRAQVAERQR